MNITTNHENEVIRKIRAVLESDVMLDYEIQGTFGKFALPKCHFSNRFQSSSNSHSL